METEKLHHIRKEMIHFANEQNDIFTHGHKLHMEEKETYFRVRFGKKITDETLFVGIEIVFYKDTESYKLFWWYCIEGKPFYAFKRYEEFTEFITLNHFYTDCCISYNPQLIELYKFAMFKKNQKDLLNDLLDNE